MVAIQKYRSRKGLIDMSFLTLTKKTGTFFKMYFRIEGFPKLFEGYAEEGSCKPYFTKDVSDEIVRYIHENLNQNDAVYLWYCPFTDSYWECRDDSNREVQFKREYIKVNDELIKVYPIYLRYYLWEVDINSQIEIQTHNKSFSAYTVWVANYVKEHYGKTLSEFLSSYTKDEAQRMYEDGMKNILNSGILPF